MVHKSERFPVSSRVKQSAPPTANVDASQLLPLEVVLEHGRSRHLSWVAFGVVAGLLFVLKLGVLGQYVGAALLLLAMFQGAAAIRTYRHEPGTFLVSTEAIQVPTGLCKGTPMALKPGQLQQAYFLRRAVPWTQAGPLLVIEAQDKAYFFPRDWFGSDSEQRRVAMALNQRLQPSDKS